MKRSLKLFAAMLCTVSVCALSAQTANLPAGSAAAAAISAQKAKDAGTPAASANQEVEVRTVSAPAAEQPGDGVRKIRLRQDDAQDEFVSKLYDLKYVQAVDIAPFLNAAVLRYNKNSTVVRVNYSKSEDPKQYVLVSTPREFMPYVDDIVKYIDKPGKQDAFGSVLEGTGITRVSYTPEYRSAQVFKPIIDDFLGSEIGRGYVNDQTNTIFWKDEHFTALDTLEWIKFLDRPIPQVSVRVNYYEVRESTLRDIGFDYLAWKNGPGVNFFNVGYNAGKLVIDETFIQAAAQALDLSTTWGYGGFFTAPQVDMSFIRMLQQSGNAKLSAHTTMTMLNTPVATLKEYDEMLANPPEEYTYKVYMTPEYQDISKNTEGRSWIGYNKLTDEDGNARPSANLEFSAFIPVVCFNADAEDIDESGFVSCSDEYYQKAHKAKNGGVIFSYDARFTNVVERSNSGMELANSTELKGGVTLGFNTEKVLTVFEQENEVEQTIGLPVLCRIPILKYLFSTTTTIKERTYIVVTAEAEMVHPSIEPSKKVSRSTSTDVAQTIKPADRLRQSAPAGEDKAEAGK